MVLWHTAGPRASAVYDVTGDGKTAAKASYGRYYYVLSTGGGGVNNVNPNANYFDHLHLERRQRRPQVPARRADRRRCVLTTGTTTTIDPNFRRPYTDEFSFGVDRELMANFKLSAAYTYRRERTCRRPPTPTIRTRRRRRRAVDPGIDGVRRHGRRRHLQFLPADLGGEPHAHHQRSDSRYRATKGWKSR